MMWASIGGGVGGRVTRSPVRLARQSPIFVPCHTYRQHALAALGRLAAHWQKCEASYTPPDMKQFFRAAIIAIATLLAAPALQAAPPGWELRNGTWVPIVEPGTGTPEAQIAKMIKDLNDGLSAVVIKDSQEWV